MHKDGELFLVTKEEMAQLMAQAGEAGANAAMKKVEEERKSSRKKIKDRRLRNTELLLRNYNMFKLSVENSVYTVRQAEEEQSANEILNIMMDKDGGEQVVESIKRSCIKTITILQHIDTMLELYEIYCERSCDELDQRRYDVLIDRFITNPALSVKDIASKYNISKESVYSDLKVAKERVSSLIFGIDGVTLK